MPPRQRVYFYSSDEWEEFIREWATGIETDYVQIKQLGGPNDRGVDVAAFKTSLGFEGEWDCFQGKHYASPLTLADVLPEVLKVLANVVADQYVLPDIYAFMAPQGCATSLNRLLSRPANFREKFLEKLTEGGALTGSTPAETLTSIVALAKETDFSRFRSIELEDALEVHRGTAYHAARFGGPLTPRRAVAPPPEEVGTHEARYVQQLGDVYVEAHPTLVLDAPAFASHPATASHFQRQRLAFYSAEALRLYARDSVPDGTFEALQDDIHAGVIDLAESPHSTRWQRLTNVLVASGQLDLGHHTLVSVSDLTDRKGICHQLANEDRLSWKEASG